MSREISEEVSTKPQEGNATKGVKAHDNQAHTAAGKEGKEGTKMGGAKGAEINPDKTNERGGALALVAHAVAGMACAILWNTPYRLLALSSSGLGLACNLLTSKLIPHFAIKLKARGFSGIDLNKTSPEIVAKIRAGGKNQAHGIPSIPEAVGIVPAFTYLIGAVMAYLPIKALLPYVYSEESRQAFPLHYLACLLTIALMTFLGFVDDVLDLRWRYKVILPFIATIPALVIYEGPTTVVMPSLEIAKSIYAMVEPIFNLLGFYQVKTATHAVTVDFGWFYYVFMGLLSCFCANCINIYAGINGLEVGQSLISAAFLILYHSIEIRAHPQQTHQALALVLSMIFFNVSLALFRFNKYPSRVFVGDTYTMFAGVHFGIASILGHFSKVIVLLFIPQILNGLYSVPQLLQIVPCPRHRVPHLRSDGKMESSKNLTLINLALEIFGPMTEKRLVYTLLAFQVSCCSLGLCIRYSQSYALTFA